MMLYFSFYLILVLLLLLFLFFLNKVEHSYMISELLTDWKISPKRNMKCDLNS